MNHTDSNDGLRRNMFISYLNEVVSIFEKYDSEGKQTSYYKACEHFLEYIQFLFADLNEMSPEARNNQMERLKSHCLVELTDVEAINELGIYGLFSRAIVQRLKIWITNYRILIKQIAYNVTTRSIEEGYRLLHEYSHRVNMWQKTPPEDIITEEILKTKEMDNEEATYLEHEKDWTDATKALFIHFLLIELNPDLNEAKKNEVLSKLTGKKQINLRQYFGVNRCMTKSGNWRIAELQAVRLMFEAMEIPTDRIQDQLNTIKKLRG